MAMSVEEIAAMTDPVLRNLWITQRYHELAVQLRDSGMAEDATWCAFAVWASKTAGTTIRGQELPSIIRDVLKTGDESASALHRFNHGLEGQLLTRLEHTHLVHIVEKVNQNVAASIAQGNLLVFSELAPLFTLLANGESDFEAAWASLDTQGVDTANVKAAFASYEKAMRQPDERPMLVLAANILAVSHEQERLQPAITAALDAAVTDLLTQLVDEEIARVVPTSTGRRAMEALVADVSDVLDRACQAALTRTMLRLVTSDETFDLDHNVPPLSKVLYPPMLADLKGSTAEGPFSQWDRTSGVGTPTGARDWAVMEERMNYIVTLFRSRQRHPGLFSPPFSDVQLAALVDGRIPEEPL